MTNTSYLRLSIAHFYLPIQVIFLYLIYIFLLLKGRIRLCTLKGSTTPSTSHPISDFVSLDKLSPTFKAFTMSLYSAIVPCDWKIAMQDPMWKTAMFEEMRVLTKNWEIIPRPVGKKIVGCIWVFKVKHNPE
jgi:hypothetical protein